MPQYLKSGNQYCYRDELKALQEIVFSHSEISIIVCTVMQHFPDQIDKFFYAQVIWYMMLCQS